MKPIFYKLIFSVICLAILIILYAGYEFLVKPIDNQRFNILFIVSDDMRPDLGCYGSTKVKTPNIDRLADQGMVFSRAYCQAPQCGPSRISLLTSLRPDTTGVYTLSNRFNRKKHPDLITLPEQFKRFGYHTQALGKVYHNGRDDPQSWSTSTWESDGKPPMFEYVDPDVVSRLKKEQITAQKLGKPFDNSRLMNIPTMRGKKISSWQAPDVDPRVLSDGKLTDKAIDTLRNIKDKPFFLAVGYIRPHLPFVAPKSFFDMYPLSEILLPHNGQPPVDAPIWAWFNATRYYDFFKRTLYYQKYGHLHGDIPFITPEDPKTAMAMASAELRTYDDIPLRGPIPLKKQLEVRRAYMASISYVDAQIGRLLEELDRLGLRDRTIIVLLGDHGWHLGEQGIWGKLTNFEISTRVPLIIATPDNNQFGKKTSGIVEFVDVYPTLCELAGLPIPKHVEGVSLVPLMKSPDRPWGKAAFSQFPRGKEVMGRSIRTNHYRYTEWIRPDDTIAARELYDHRTTHDENINIATNPKHRELIKTLSNQLHFD